MVSLRVQLRRSVFVFAFAIVLSAIALEAADKPSRPRGRTQSLAAQRTATPPIIDGHLIDEVWAEAPAADGFWVSQLRRAPRDDTRVRVLYDDEALYFAVLCFDERPELIRALQITRDADPGLDDRITIELDPYHNHRSISRFTVTARGTQSDVMAGGRARKVEWKGAWSAAARRTAEGWTAEIAIPLSILEFDRSASVFGLNFSRYQSRNREWSDWADLTPQRLPEESGHLAGLRLRQVPTTGRLALMQYVSGNTAAADVIDPRLFGTGMDVRYQWKGSMTSMVSVRPDFSAIDADVQSVGFSYNERFLNDRRPFFQEGAGFFGDRGVFHSGRVEDFDVGVKTFGRVDAYQAGMLATQGTGRSDYVGRVVREVGSAFNLSATLVGTERESYGNTTLQVAAGGRVGRHFKFEGDLARSDTNRRDGDGARGHGALTYQGTHWYTGGWFDSTAEDYFPANGFIAADLLGTMGRGAYAGYNRAFDEGLFKRADASLSYDVRDTMNGLRQREMASLHAGTEVSSSVQVNAGMTIGTYRPRGAEPGAWRDVVNDDRLYLASAYYRSPSGFFGYGAQYSWGFVGSSDYESIAPTLWLAPGANMSFSYSFDRAHHDHVQAQHVLSGTWDIDSAQSVSARWVDYEGGHYRLSYRRALSRGVDAYGVYSADPYDPGTLNVKLVWTMTPRSGL